MMANVPDCDILESELEFQDRNYVYFQTNAIEKVQPTSYQASSYGLNSTTAVLLHNCPVGWGCRIHRLLLCRGVRPPPNECPGYDTKQSDGEVPAVLELWGMRSTPSLPSLSGPLWPGVVAPDKGPIYGSNRTNGVLMLN